VTSLGLFGAPRSHSAPPTVIWRHIVTRRPGKCAPLTPLVTPPAANIFCCFLQSIQLRDCARIATSIFLSFDSFSPFCKNDPVHFKLLLLEFVKRAKPIFARKIKFRTFSAYLVEILFVNKFLSFSACALCTRMRQKCLHFSEVFWLLAGTKTSEYYQNPS